MGRANERFTDQVNAKAVHPDNLIYSIEHAVPPPSADSPHLQTYIETLDWLKRIIKPDNDGRFNKDAIKQEL